MTITTQEIESIRADARIMCPRDLAEKYQRSKSTMYNLLRRENIKCLVRSEYRISDKVIKARANRVYKSTMFEQGRKDMDDDKQIKRPASNDNIQSLILINKDNPVCKAWV